MPTVEMYALSNPGDRDRTDDPSLRDISAPGLGEMIGRAPAMLDLFQQIELVATTDVTVLAEGETGTGKDLVARTVHCLSHRAAKPFIAFNASNLQEQLFEMIGERRSVWLG